MFNGCNDSAYGWIRKYIVIANEVVFFLVMWLSSALHGVHLHQTEKTILYKQMNTLHGSILVRSVHHCFRIMFLPFRRIVIRSFSVLAVKLDIYPYADNNMLHILCVPHIKIYCFTMRNHNNYYLNQRTSSISLNQYTKIIQDRTEFVFNRI